MSPTITLSGFDEFARDMGKLSAAAKSTTTMDALEAGARVIQAYAQENARNKLNKHPLGNLTNNIVVKREGKFVLAGVFGVVYARIQEFGGPILARNKPWLTFQIDGQWIRTKKIVIPARPYLRPSVDNHLEEIKQAVGDALRGLLQKAIR